MLQHLNSLETPSLGVGWLRLLLFHFLLPAAQSGFTKIKARQLRSKSPFRGRATKSSDAAQSRSNDVVCDLSLSVAFGNHGWRTSFIAPACWIIEAAFLLHESGWRPPRSAGIRGDLLSFQRGEIVSFVFQASGDISLSFHLCRAWLAGAASRPQAKNFVRWLGITSLGLSRDKYSVHVITLQK